MSLASYKTVLESATSHEQSAAESSAVMAQRRRSCVVRILPDYIVGPPNLRVLLTAQKQQGYLPHTYTHRVARTHASPAKQPRKNILTNTIIAMVVSLSQQTFGCHLVVTLVPQTFTVTSNISAFTF